MFTYHMNVEVEVFSAVVGLLVIFYDDRKSEAAMAVWRAPDDGHCNARNMLSSVCTAKQ